jgi:ribosomal protein L24
MRNTRTIKVGERVTISHGPRDTFEGIVTENNPASSLIYVDGYAYERYKVEKMDNKSIRQCVVIAP